MKAKALAGELAAAKARIADLGEFGLLFFMPQSGHRPPEMRTLRLASLPCTGTGATAACRG